MLLVAAKAQQPASLTLCNLAHVYMGPYIEAHVGEDLNRG
jgi:hypothetical protein